MKKAKDLKSAPEWEYAIDDTDRFWARVEGPKEIKRLEDIIRIAIAGIRVTCVIEIRRKNIEIKVTEAEADGHQVDINAFLLLAEYTFSFEESTGHVSKVYVFGRTQKDRGIPKGDRDVANQRLRVDYERLRLANIEFKEVYFES